MKSLSLTSQLSAKPFQLLLKLLCVAPVAFAVGCQQHMAEQPAPRTYEPLAARPATGDTNNELFVASWKMPEGGTVHRGQRSAVDPLVTGLTEAGRKPRKAYPAEYLAKLPADKAKLLEDASTQPGAPDNVDHFVKAFPWKLTEEDLKRGQIRYNVECAVCHGAAGNGKGRIAERGTLWPPSYHRDASGQAFDVYGGKESGVSLKQGHSRGFNRFGIDVALDEVPVGYIFEVITRGYGSMPYLHDKITPEDRWRITAYVRTLQLSQGAKVAELPADVKKQLDEQTKPGAKPGPKVDDHGHDHADDATKKGGH